MRSDRPAGPEPLARLADVLARAGDGVRPTPRELAELVWLAGRMEPAAGAADPARENPAPRQDVRREPREEGEAAPPAPLPPPGRAPSAEQPRRAPLHLPSPGTTPSGPYASLLAPAPPMLRHTLGLQRSLRPLKRRTDAPVGHRLDERATADRIARLGAAPEWWLPVLRPARERWLRLNLVHDTGPTMPVWRPLIRELHATLAQSGVFRTVSALCAEPDGEVRGHGAHGPAGDRAVTLVISDCMGPQWRRGEAGTRWYGTLRRWGRQMPLAVVQPLPEHLWRDTALPAAPGVFSAPFPAAPAAALTFSPYDRHEARDGHGTLPLPVLEAEPRWLANWAGLVASADGGRFPGSAATLGVPLGPDDTEDRTDVARLSAEELVLRFRATASPEAFRLAGHLAVGRPDLPVMRLVQRAVEPDPRPQHLAEVILSGMLGTVPGPPGSYAFRPGVRDLLLRGLPRSSRGRTAELLSRVGGLIEERSGVAPGEFRAVTPAPSGSGTGVDGDAFATVGQESLRRLYDSTERAGRAGRLLGGRYRLVRRTEPGGMGWLAEDTQDGDAPVLVRRYPPLPRSPAGFTDLCRRLAEVRHPGIAAVRDHGFDDGTPYLVREFVAGPTLQQRLGRGRDLSAGEVVALLPPLTEAVLALHAQDGPRSLLEAHAVVLGSDGPVLTCLDAAPLSSATRAGNLRALGHIVRGLYRGGSDTLASELTVACAELDSGAPELQQRGVERLLRLSPHHAGLRFSLLGPLRVTLGGRPVPVDDPREQAVLCMLLLREGRPATGDELAAGLGNDPVPFVTDGLLDTYVARLRQVLGPDVLTVEETGYALRLERLCAPDDVDVLRARRLAAGSERARAAEDLPASRELAQQALELWRDEPLRGVPGPAARRTRDELDALRARLSLLSSGPGQDPPPQPLRPTITFLTDDLTGHPETRITLEYAVHELLSRGSLAPHQYEVTVLPNGYRVRTEPGSYLLPVLVATLRWLPVALARLADRPRLQVLLWENPSAPAHLPESHRSAPAEITVVVSPALYEEFTASSAAQGPRHFQPLYRGSERDTPPVAWHCTWAAAERGSRERDLVQGPFITHDLHELGMPTPGRTAVVHTRSDGPLTLLDPVRPYGTGPPRPETYYSVDLTPHRARHTLPLPSSGKGVFTAVVELSWHVDDPVAFVRGETTGISGLLLEHLRDAATRITRRHPLRRAGAAQRAVNAELRAWPVPGLAVSCSVHLAPEGTPAPVPERAVPARRRLSAVLADAETVLIGFDGPLARLFPAQTAREAALALLSVVAEHRDPRDALAGRPPSAGGTAGNEAFVHPLDVLRAFAHDRLGPVLRARLDELELSAVPDAPTTHRSVALVRALHDSGRRVVVVTDVCAEAVHRYVKPHRLPLAGVHGRRDDLGLLMPHPDCLLRALGSPGGPAPSGVLISSSVAELTAAQQVGLRPVGYAPTAAGRRRLREGGGEITLSSLEPLLEAARGL
ncbi:SAV_2336 N-terminal domain-related protein [Streptomyces sp. NPDC058964]|uniref:SAV_2336 N-terminal domain-related protein n=1 Tax=Streptomyces sp. NPDC058964 TaxID=3346681 RepID=UPI0036894477